MKRWRKDEGGTKKEGKHWLSLSNQTQSVFSAFLSRKAHTHTHKKDKLTVALWHCWLHAINLLLFSIWHKQTLSLIYTQQAGRLFFFSHSVVSRRANSSPSFSQSLRFLCSPEGSCCLSSKCGPGSIFSTSSILRHPGRAKIWVSRMLSGA